MQVNKNNVVQNKQSNKNQKQVKQIKEVLFSRHHFLNSHLRMTNSFPL